MVVAGQTLVHLTGFKAVGYYYHFQGISANQKVTAASTDLALAILPVAFLWNLQMKIWKKIGICFLMALGFVLASLPDYSS